MRRVPESELQSEFEREVCWGDDERYYFNSNRRKASVMGYFTRLNEVIKLVKKHSPGKRVLDLACAQGNFGLLLAEGGFDVTAVDIHPEFLAYAQKKHTHGSFKTHQANLMEYRGQEPFDCVLAGEIIEHVAHPEKLLESVASNLKPGGILVLTTPNGNEFESGLPTYSQVTDLEEFIPRQFHWGDHLFLYTVEELSGLFARAGLEVVCSERYNSSYVTQLKGLRYLIPRGALEWLERKTRGFRRGGKDSTNLIIMVGRKKQAG